MAGTLYAVAKSGDPMRCGAQRRSGGPCRHLAGMRTDHPGKGRCYLHGGGSRMKHGRYSTIKHERLRELVEAEEKDTDPLDIVPEIRACRALFRDYIERYEEYTDALIAWHDSFIDEEKVKNPKPQQVLDIADAYRILAEVTRMVERVERIRAANAISRPDLNRIMNEMGRVVATFVDPGVAQKVKEQWLAIRL